MQLGAMFLPTYPSPHLYPRLYELGHLPPAERLTVDDLGAIAATVP